MGKKRILVVDDEVQLVEMIQMRLEANDFEVSTAYDGQQGLDAARAQQPDLIILDLMLPKMDGYKVCRLLKFDEKYRHIPIILFTARAREQDKQLGEDVGADAYVVKPFEPEALLSTISRLLEKRA